MTVTWQPIQFIKINNYMLVKGYHNLIGYFNPHVTTITHSHMIINNTMCSQYYINLGYESHTIKHPSLTVSIYPVNIINVDKCIYTYLNVDKTTVDGGLKYENLLNQTKQCLYMFKYVYIC